MNTSQQQHTTWDAPLLAPCSAVLPVWARHLDTSRAHSQAAVDEMLFAFAETGPRLDMATRQSRQIAAALAHGEGGNTQLAQACEQEFSPLLVNLGAAAVLVVRRAIAMIHQTVEALENIAKLFDYETQMVSRQLDRMYVGFQCQDRISQMMSLLHTDIQRLGEAIAEPQADPDGSCAALACAAGIAIRHGLTPPEPQRSGLRQRQGWRYRGCNPFFPGPSA